MPDNLQKMMDLWALVAILLIVASKTYATNCPPLDLHVGIDVLYWKPVHCPIYAAKRFNFSPNVFNPVDELYLTGKYNPGVRARLGYQKCNWHGDISYLYFYSTNMVAEERDDFQYMTIQGPGFNNILVQMTAAESSATFRYQNVDGRFGHHFCLKQGFLFFLYGNIRWVKIDFKNSAQGPSELDPTFFDFFKQRSYFNGGGCGLGAGGEYKLCGRFNLHGNVGFMAIIGETQLKNYSANFLYSENGVTLTLPSFLDRPERWGHILPAFTFCIGLNYRFCWCRYEIQTEIGYELDYYKNILRYASDNLASTQITRDLPFFSCQNIGFSGLNLNCSIKF